MAGLTIDITPNSIQVDFGDFSGAAGMQKGTWALITVLHGMFDGDVTTVESADSSRWTLSHIANPLAMTVDTIDGVAPTSALDLYNKIAALID